jgi:hypothetical protein
MEYKKDESKPEELFNPSQEEKDAVKRVTQRFLDMKTERDRARREFDNRTITQYVKDCSDSYNGVVSDELKATKEDWQSLAWDHKTRGKVKAIVAMVVGARPFISILGKSRKSDGYAKDVLDIYEDTWKQEQGSYKLFLQALSATIKGTVIVEEMYNEQKIKRKEIDSINQETGAISFNEKEVIKGGVGKCESKIVPLLDFYPNENSAEIEHDCCVVKKFTQKAFMNRFGKYPNAEVVKAGTFIFDMGSGDYRSQATNQSELIEVVRYYNEDFDEFIIIADGIWINKQEGNKIAPIPFDHHKLPFAKGVFELADEECFYGKSLPDLMRGEQDPSNALLRLMIDQGILSINKPVIIGGGVEIDSYQLYPGAVKTFSGNVDQIKELDISGPDQSAFQLLQLLRTNSDINTSIDPTAQGVHSGRKTARETVILDENSKRNSGPFQLHIYKLLWDRAVLRVENIKQFYTQPLQYSVLKDKNGDAEVDSEGNNIETNPQYREITVSKPGKNTRWIQIKPEIKGCEFELRFVEDYEMPQSQSARIELAKAVLDEAKVNPLISADEATIDYLESIRKNPDRFYIKPTPQAMQFQQEQGLPPKNDINSSMPV